jgi:hypothetical protein
MKYYSRTQRVVGQPGATERTPARPVRFGVALLALAVLSAVQPAPAAVQGCVGDCGNDGTVTIDELLKGVNIALGTLSLGQCSCFDMSGDSAVTIDELLVAVNNALNGCQFPTPTPTPIPTSIPEDTNGLEALGVGTDIFGEYATEDNLKARVLDVGALNQDRLLVLNKFVEEREYEALTGNTIEEFASRRATSVGVSGSYYYFSASLQVSFTNQTYRKTGYSYATITENTLKHSVKISTDRWYADYLKNYLTPAAADAINNTDPLHDWTPEQIVASYGTHVMLGVYVGARLDYNMALQIEEAADKSQFESYAKVRFKGAFASATIEAGMDSSTETRMNGYEKTVNITSKGGRAEWADPQDDDVYKLWHASIDSNPVFCGIVKNALIPIWEFADSPDRRAAIQDYYTSYADSKASEFTPVLPTPRFVDNGDGTVTDNDTGLMWEKKTTDGSVHDVNKTYTWSQAGNSGPWGTVFTEFLAALNDEPTHNPAHCFAGYCDWRLPKVNEDCMGWTGTTWDYWHCYDKVKELESILYSTPCTKSPCIDDIFGPTREGWYWSFTTHKYNTENSKYYAWQVNFGTGYLQYVRKGGSYYVRAVRTIGP